MEVVDLFWKEWLSGWVGELVLNQIGLSLPNVFDCNDSSRMRLGLVSGGLGFGKCHLWRLEKWNEH